MDGLRRRRHTSPPLLNCTRHRDRIASTAHGSTSLAPSSAKPSFVSRIHRQLAPARRFGVTGSAARPFSETGSPARASETTLSAKYSAARASFEKLLSATGYAASASEKAFSARNSAPRASEKAFSATSSARRASETALSATAPAASGSFETVLAARASEKALSASISAARGSFETPLSATGSASHGSETALSATGSTARSSFETAISFDLAEHKASVVGILSAPISSALALDNFNPGSSTLGHRTDHAATAANSGSYAAHGGGLVTLLQDPTPTSPTARTSSPMRHRMDNSAADVTSSTTGSTSAPAGTPPRTTSPTVSNSTSTTRTNGLGGSPPGPPDPKASAEKMNEARFTRDNVLYTFSFAALGATLGTMKDIADDWNSGFKIVFMVLMMSCFGMIAVGVMSSTSTRVSEVSIISAIMSRSSCILSCGLLLITLSFFAGGWCAFSIGILASIAVMVVMICLWMSGDPASATPVTSFFSSCFSKIKSAWGSRSQPTLPL